MPPTSTNVPATIQNIINKVRRITARPSAAQISDEQIVDYVNQFYIYDFPEHLRLESLRVNYQFLTQANIPVYDLPTDIYLTIMPPIFIAGYQSFLTQSRESFFRINPMLKMLNTQVTTGNGTVGPYTFTLPNTPILQGFKTNPPGAFFNSTAANDTDPRYLNWNVLITGNHGAGTGGTPNWYSLVDDGRGNLFDLNDGTTISASARGTIDYITGIVNITAFRGTIDVGQPINAQYTPYVASRPMSACFYQDQISLFPIPDQPYTVSFEAYKYPFSFTNDPITGIVVTETPQLKEWWQLLAFGASDKIFIDNGDIENMQKFRPLLDEQMRLAQRRSIVQYASERVSTIYSEQSQTSQYPFGNLFNGF